MNTNLLDINNDILNIFSDCVKKMILIEWKTSKEHYHRNGKDNVIYLIALKIVIFQIIDNHIYSNTCPYTTSRNE
jgi:hypothetical protein